MTTTQGISILLIAMALALTACQNASYLTETSAAPSSDCISGGESVISGYDLNGNGRLDSGEIEHHQIECNGVHSPKGVE